MTGIVTRTAIEIAVLEVEVLFLADAAEFWMLRIEFFESRTKAVFVPATNYDLVSCPGTEHHLLKTLVPDEVRQDSEGVHAHTVDSSSLWIPELVSLVVDAVDDDFIEFAGVSKLKSEFTVLLFA